MSKLIGIDIQTAHVRAVLIGTSYRRITLEAVAEVERDRFATLEEALQTCLVPLVPHSDAVAIAVDGAQSFLHRLSIPRTAEKQLADVIRFELEAQVPVDIDELVYDWAVLREPGPGGAIEVLAVAARTDHVKDRIDLVSRAVAREAERVGVGALPLANLAAVTPALSEDEPIAVLELGADRSELVVLLGGHLVFGRTLSIGISGLPRTAPMLAAQLRQTAAGAGARVGRPLSRIYLTGPGSAASGAEAYLASEVGVPVLGLPPPEVDGLDADKVEALPRFARALGLALGLRRARDLDLRRGPLSYQRGYAFIKERAPVLAALGGVILLSFFFSSWASLRSLAHEQEQLTAQLTAATKEALGEETAEPDRARELLEGAKARAETDPMPHIDGFDTMVDLSKSVPASIVHDVEELDLAREHFKIRGIVASAGEAQQIADALKLLGCYSDVKISKVSQVVNGTRQKYVLESDLKCPEDAAPKKKAEAAPAEEGEKK